MQQIKLTVAQRLDDKTQIEMASMKKIRLAVAQRYLRRYNNGDAHLECVYRDGEHPKPNKDYSTLFVGFTLSIVIVFTPKAKVFLRRDDTRIAQITEGLPSVSGHFDPFTGEFLQEIPY